MFMYKYFISTSRCMSGMHKNEFLNGSAGLSGSMCSYISLAYSKNLWITVWSSSKQCFTFSYLYKQLEMILAVLQNVYRKPSEAVKLGFPISIIGLVLNGEVYINVQLLFQWFTLLFKSCSCFWGRLLCVPRLHSFDQKYSKTVIISNKITIKNVIKNEKNTA